MARGGYRRPNSPAPVSGPGALSRRTDGGPVQGAKEMSGGQYGERQEMQALQTAAPMAGNRTPTRASMMPKITPLTAPTQRPDEAPEVGMPFGEGPGPEILDVYATAPRAEARPLSQIMSDIARYDDSEELYALYEYLIDRGL